MTRGSGTGVECGEGRGGGWQGEGAEEEGGSAGGGGERGGEGAQRRAARHRRGAAMLRAQSGPARPGAGCRHRCAAEVGPGRQAPASPRSPQGRSPGPARIGAARAVRGGGGRVAAGPTAPGMPQRPAEGERGVRAGSSAAPRGGENGWGPDPAARPPLGRGRLGGPCRPVPGLGAWSAASGAGGPGCGAGPRGGRRGWKSACGAGRGGTWPPCRAPAGGT